jgi:hypothetical protein
MIRQRRGSAQGQARDGGQLGLLASAPEPLEEGNVAARSSSSAAT